MKDWTVSKRLISVSYFLVTYFFIIVPEYFEHVSEVNHNLLFNMLVT